MKPMLGSESDQLWQLIQLCGEHFRHLTYHKTSGDLDSKKRWTVTGMAGEPRHKMMFIGRTPHEVVQKLLDKIAPPKDR